jgi:hypothetical protein
MLTDRLRRFHDAVAVATAKHGKNPAAVTNEVIGIAFPATIAAAEDEGADAMVRAGVLAKVKRMMTKEGEAGQADFSQIAPDFQHIVRKLHGHSHYVPSRDEYIHVGALIDEPELLDEARKFKRQKGVETIAEASVLDELYDAVMSK